MMTILAVEVLKFKDKLIMIFARKNVNSFSYLLPHVATGYFFSENHKNNIYVLHTDACPQKSFLIHKPYWNRATLSKDYIN